MGWRRSILMALASQNTHNAKVAAPQIDFTLIHA